jgi:hypothetical protein
MCFLTGYFYLDDDDTKASGPAAFPGSGLECFVTPAS